VDIDIRFHMGNFNPMKIKKLTCTMVHLVRLQVYDMDHHRYLYQLALGPLRLVNTWPIYVVNGYKFHIEAWNEGKTTYNCGVCMKGAREGGIENNFMDFERCS